MPEHDDRRLFECLSLEGAQAGLSWETILRKRQNYRRAFERFDPARVAAYGEDKVAALLADGGIVRNRLKIRSVISNARTFLQVQREHGSFDAYLWSFVGGRASHAPHPAPERVTRSAISDRLSQDLRRRGFKFVGTTICYALMQAVGLVNDHDARCHRRREVSDLV